MNDTATLAAEPGGLRHPGLALPGRWAGNFTGDGDTSVRHVSARHAGRRRTPPPGEGTG